MECLSHLSALFSQVTAATTSTPSLDGPPYDILCLGSGWTYSFLGPVAANAGLKITFTSRTPKAGGFVFTFDPESDDEEPFRALPDAKAIVIIFPLYSKEAVQRLVRGYLKSRLDVGDGDKLDNIVAPNLILLGSTGIWDHGPSFQFAPLSDGLNYEEKIADFSGSTSVWKDRHSKVQQVPRAIAENAFLSLNKQNNVIRKTLVPTSVLCLSGLWGHGRSPRRYISVLAPSKEKLKALGSVHLVHGHDVARAVLAMTTQWDKTEAQRWILTNERV
jgi:hypothetical protein